MIRVSFKAVAFAAPLLAALAVSGCGKNESVTGESHYTVSGHVVTSANGGGVPKVIVTIDDRSYRTGLGGYYQIANLAPGEYLMKASKDCCYEPYRATIMVTASVIQDITLDPLGPSGER